MLTGFVLGGAEDRELGRLPRASCVVFFGERPYKKWSSYKGCMVDALASRSDEGRGVAAISLDEVLTNR